MTQVRDQIAVSTANLPAAHQLKSAVTALPTRPNEGSQRFILFLYVVQRDITLSIIEVQDLGHYAGTAR